MAVAHRLRVNPVLEVNFYLADQNPHRDRTRGISVYSLHLADALAATGKVSLQFLTSTSSASPATADRIRQFPFRTDSPIPRLLTDHLHRFMLPPADLCHYPKGYLPSLLPRLPIVSSIHDTIIEHYHQNYPKSRSRLASLYWMQMMKRSIARTDHILTISEFSRNRLLDFCDRHRLRPPPITVSYLGCHEPPSDGNITSRSELVVALASPLPHKQINRLLELWRSFELRHKSAPRLLLIGRLTPAQEKLASACRTVDNEQIPDSTGLFGILRAARALILPSEIEGFGIPAIEALFVGTPVVFVRGTAVDEILEHPDVGGFDLNDQESFDSALLDTLALPSGSTRQLADRLRAKYQWSEIARRTMEAYRDVA